MNHLPDLLFYLAVFASVFGLLWFLASRSNRNLASKPVFIFVISIFLFFVSHKLEKAHPVFTERIDSVERVFMHLPKEYSLLVQEQNSDELKLRYFEWLTEVRFYKDVPSDKKMWVLYKCRGKSEDQSTWRNCSLELHLHSGKSVEGAGWQRQEDKNLRKGATQVVE